MPSPDEVIPVAFALHNSPRRYALLVGSGISRDTGILTAGEITDDLIRQIAELQHKKIGDQKPVDWYQKQFGSSPTFTGLFDRFAKSKDNQVAILRQYFEPVDGDRQPQKIEPTPAHQTIARLVRDGIVSVILTPNFDNLLETAIEKETGRVPVVITPDSKPEKMEVAGDYCRIIKMNGSFPDTALKLTPADLAQYEPELAAYLDRIFSEYGLVICGWSGDHDTGLVDILAKERTRRFAIFWCRWEIQGKSPEKIPDNIQTKLHPPIVGIVSANEFLDDLESQIALLSRHERKAPITVERAIQKVKAALRDPRPELVLPDLIHDETDRVLAEVNRLDIFPEGIVDGKACFRNRLYEIERTAAPLAAMVATIAYYDNGDNSALITETIDRLVNLPRIGDISSGIYREISGKMVGELEYYGYFYSLRYYPALLTIYSSGIVAVRKENFNSLSAILEKPRMRRFVVREVAWKDVSYFEPVNVGSIIWNVEQWTLEFGAERFGKQGNLYYFPTKVIQSIISSLIPNEYHFESAFDIFEYLFGLSYLNQTPTEPNSEANPLRSRLWVQTVGFGGSGTIRFPDPLLSYMSKIAPIIERSTFFNGDKQRFLRCVWKHGKIFHVNVPETGISLPLGGFPGL